MTGYPPYEVAGYFCTETHNTKYKTSYITIFYRIFLIKFHCFDVGSVLIILQLHKQTLIRFQGRVKLKPEQLISELARFFRWAFNLVNWLCLFSIAPNDLQFTNEKKDNVKALQNTCCDEGSQFITPQRPKQRFAYDRFLKAILRLKVA